VTGSLWLIDKSALIRLSSSPARDEWFEWIERNWIAFCARSLDCRRRRSSLAQLCLCDKDFNLIANVRESA
jgi:hypothetical protein